MATVAELDDVTLDLEVDGEEQRRTLGRRVWERGGWATIAIAYEERRGGGDGEWVKKLVLMRMQKVRDAWKKHASVTLSGDEARALAGDIAGWLPSA